MSRRGAAKGITGPCCPAYNTTSHCDCAAWLAGFVFLALVICLILLGILVFETKDSASTSRFSLTGVGSQCIPPGDPDGQIVGKLILDSNQKTIEWDFLASDLDAILSIIIEGPLNTTNIDNGPTKVVLCGGPSSVACDQTSPIQGLLTELYTGLGPRQDILDIQENAPLYYLIVRTSLFPDCAVRAPLNAVF